MLFAAANALADAWLRALEDKFLKIYSASNDGGRPSNIAQNNSSHHTLPTYHPRMLNQVAPGVHAPQLRHERFVGLYDAPAASYAIHRFICGNLFHRCDVIDHDACTATDALMAVHQNGQNVALNVTWGGACGEYGPRLFENGS